MSTEQAEKRQLADKINEQLEKIKKATAPTIEKIRVKTDPIVLKVREFLKDDEKEINDGRSLESLLMTLGLVMTSMGFALAFPSILTLIAAIAIIGYRQFSLLKLQEQSAEDKLFEDKKRNDLVGRWVCSYSIFTNPEDHTTIYDTHHRPEPNDEKMRRENRIMAASGATGVIRLYRVLVTNLGLGYISVEGKLKYLDRKMVTLKSLLTNFRDHLAQLVLTQAILLLGFSLMGLTAGYFLWTIAYLTAFSLFIELRREKRLEPEAVALAEMTREDTVVMPAFNLQSHDLPSPPPLEKKPEEPPQPTL